MSAISPGAKEKLAALFEQQQGVVISRGQVEQVAAQLDPMKRLRRNGGARDILDRKGIALLWGKGDREVIQRLGLGTLRPDEFISYTPRDEAEWELLRKSGHSELRRPRAW